MRAFSTFLRWFVGRVARILGDFSGVIGEGFPSSKEFGALQINLHNPIVINRQPSAHWSDAMLLLLFGLRVLLDPMTRPRWYGKITGRVSASAFCILASLPRCFFISQVRRT